MFLDLSPKLMEIKTEINKSGPMKLKSVCTAKETLKHNLQNERKYLQIMQLKGGSYPKYTNSSTQLNIKNTNKQPSQ